MRMIIKLKLKAMKNCVMQQLDLENEGEDEEEEDFHKKPPKFISFKVKMFNIEEVDNMIIDDFSSDSSESSSESSMDERREKIRKAKQILKKSETTRI